MEQARDTKFGMSVFNEKLMNAANAKITAFTVSELLRENQQGVGGTVTDTPPHLDYG